MGNSSRLKDIHCLLTSLLYFLKNSDKQFNDQPLTFPSDIELWTLAASCSTTLKGWEVLPAGYIPSAEDDWLPRGEGRLAWSSSSVWICLRTSGCLMRRLPPAHTLGAASSSSSSSPFKITKSISDSQTVSVKPMYKGMIFLPQPYTALVVMVHIS